MQELKPSKYRNFMKMCSDFYQEAKNEFDGGEDCHEISGIYTKNGNPWIVFFGQDRN